MERINNISLKDLLPRVFAQNQDAGRNRASDVWLGTVTFERGQRYMITAESGSGKSSLCSYLYGHRNDYEGVVLFDDSDISAFDSNHWSKLRREHISLLPQEMRLFPELTVMENIELKNSLTNYKSTQEIETMLARLEIEDKKSELVGLLSIGQQQRVAIVRALCQPMDYLLLDEPVSHLDERANRLVASLVEEEITKQQSALIVTSVGNPLLIKAQAMKL